MKRYKTAVVTIVAVITFIFSQCLMAQSESMVPGAAPILPVRGYVLLNNGDTIYGSIRWALRYIENNPVEIKFTGPNGSAVTYKAGEIRGFGNNTEIWVEEINQPVVMEMEHYLTVPSAKKGTPVFMNRLINGRITVFQNRSAIISGGSTVKTDSHIDGIEFSFIPGEGLYIGPTYRTDYRIIYARSRYSSYYVSIDNGELKKLDKDNYNSLFPDLFGECPVINEEIKRNPDLVKFKSFMILAEIYNRLCDN